MCFEQSQFKGKNRIEETKKKRRIDATEDETQFAHNMI